MKTNSAYSINSNKVVSETIEGETIIINLENGNYYSMNASGSVLWGLLQHGSTLDEMIKQFTVRYDAPLNLIEQSLRDLTGFLLKEGLIMESAQSDAPLQAWSGQREKFTPPSIERYEDMQEMLLADPIHDVDPVGWPTLKQQSL